MSTAPAKLVLQFKITLQGIEPPIWRRIQVPDSYSFWDLHVAIQDAMGWEDYHLHAFRMSDPDTNEMVEIGIPEEDDFGGEDVIPGWEVGVADLLAPGGIVPYEYDFGDSWEHEVELENVLPAEAGVSYPRCLDGARACPLEDCGGVQGYEEMLRILANPKHAEHESVVEWIGPGFDPEDFDPAEVTFDDPGERWAFAFEDE
jgi:Plasmid pRiA4b ORF-3-like protein